MLRCLGACALGVATLLVPVVRAQPYPPDLALDHPAIRYWERAPDNAVSRLDAGLIEGTSTLAFADGGLGYLPSLLAQLDVGIDSQLMVFSKTSLQADIVSPRQPRAIYFNDDVAVGFVPDADLIEVAAVDAGVGVAFYGLPTERSDRARFSRSTCLRCHHGPATLGVPGLYVGSVFTNPSGRANIHLGTVVTDHRTEFDERWGGWYVTGTHGALRHRGNAVARDPSAPDRLVTEGTQNVTSLTGTLDTSRYLSPVSDIVALMTLEHQTQMVNLMTRLTWQARISSAESGGDVMDGAVGALVEDLLAYMLFVDEAPLPDPVTGVSTFTATFPERGPHDGLGRSLRDFDLRTRLFRHPLSYMIYSRAFDGIPDHVRARLYQRLHAVLTGTDRSGEFTHLSSDDRQAVLDIVRDTKPDLPDYWR